MSSETHLVFVYGTLRRGASNAFRMEGAEFVREGWVRGRLFKIDWYPGIVLSEKGSSVRGELWRVGDLMLADLDEFEGGEYRRVEVAAYSGVADPQWREWEGMESSAWIWEWKGKVECFERIHSGDWMDIERPRPPKVFSALGCLSLVALPVGGAVILNSMIRIFGYSRVFEMIGAGLVLITPFVGLLLSRIGGRRREAGDRLRSVTEAVAIIWGTVAVAISAIYLLYFLGHLVTPFEE